MSGSSTGDTARERAFAKRELAQDARELEQDERERLHDLLAGVLGHDLRAPLQGMLMISAVLLAGKRLSATDASSVERLARSARRMSRMIEQLLDFTRARFGAAMPLAVSEVDLIPLASSIIDELRSGRPGCVIELAAASPTPFVLDPDRMGRALSNVIGNAVAHSPAGAAVRVVIALEPELVIEVHNQGDPIPPELLPFVFDPFRRGRTEANTDGLGLGLFITREIVTAHGGSIDIRSSADSGTSVRIVLPARE